MPDRVEPLVVEPDPLAGIDVVDAQALCGSGAEHRNRLVRGGGVEVAPLRERDVQGVQEVEAGGLDVEGVGVHFRDQRRAVHRAADLARLRDVFDRVDAGDHRRRRQR